MKPKIRRKEIINIKAEIDSIKNRKTMEKSVKTKINYLRSIVLVNFQPGWIRNNSRIDPGWMRKDINYQCQEWGDNITSDTTVIKRRLKR